MLRVATNELKKESRFTGDGYYVAASTPEFIFIVETELQLSSNKYKILQHDCADKDFIVEINKSENLQILEIINFAFHRIFEYLEENQKFNYSLRLYLSQDIEIPEWRQFTIEVNSELQDFESREDLWDKLIEIFDRSYNEYILRTDIIETEIEKDAYRRMSIVLY